MKSFELPCFIVPWFGLQEVKTFVRKSKDREEECFNWMGEVSVLSLLAVFIHAVSNNGEINRTLSWILRGSLSFSFDNEFISFAVSVREDNHNHWINDLLLFNIRHFVVCSIENLISKDVLNKLSHHDVHIDFGCSSEASLFHLLLPEMEISLLQFSLSVCIELIELIFEELGHYSEARSIEKEIELLIVFLSLGVGNVDLGHLGLLLLLSTFLRSWINWVSSSNLLILLYNLGIRFSLGLGNILY